MQTKFQSIYTLKEKGTDHIKTKRYSWAMVYLNDALKQIQAAIETVSDEEQMEALVKDLKLPCHKNLSLCYWKNGNNEACIEQCEQVLEIEPNCVKILFRLGNAHYNLGHMETAEQQLRKAYLLDPLEKEIMKLLEKIEISKRRRSKDQADASTISGPQEQKKSGIGATIKSLLFLPVLIFLFFWSIFQSMTSSVRRKITRK